MIGVFVYLAGLATFVAGTTWGIMRGLDWLAQCDGDEYL